MRYSAEVWHQAIGMVAGLSGLSANRLAANAGLDPSALNHSRRENRAISLSTISAAIRAANVSPEEFASLVEIAESRRQRLELSNWAVVQSGHATKRRGQPCEAPSS